MTAAHELLQMRPVREPLSMDQNSTGQLLILHSDQRVFYLLVSTFL